MSASICGLRFSVNYVTERLENLMMVLSSLWESRNPPLRHRDTETRRFYSKFEVDEVLDSLSIRTMILVSALCDSVVNRI